MGLLRSLADVWKNTPALCVQVPFSRVFSGRLPQTQQYPMPFISMLTSAGWNQDRTDKTTVSRQILAFHIWVDDYRLHEAENIETAIYNSYANQCWEVEPGLKILDILDHGEGMKHQTTIATVKAWEVVRLMTLVLERERVDPATCLDGCKDSEYHSESAYISSAEEWPRPTESSAHSAG